MNANDFSKPSDNEKYPSTFPDSFINPKFKDKAYDLQCAKAIWYANWNTYGNAFGNPYRMRILDNCLWSRGTNSQTDFSVRPSAKNDDHANPLLSNIDFSPVNEVVRHCNEWKTRLREQSYTLSATAINPAAAVAKQDKVHRAEAYRQLKPLLNQFNQMAQANIAPKNPAPHDFESQREAEIFYNLGDKANGELMAEVGNEYVMNENQWDSELSLELANWLCDSGYGFVVNEVDGKGKIRTWVPNPLNSGFEEFEGPLNKRMSKFWTIRLKTGGQIIAESGNTLTDADLIKLAQNSAGKFGNPTFPSNWSQMGQYGYMNPDTPNGLLYYFESWKFPVLEAWWEDWYIQNYRRIKVTSTGETVAYGPVDYEYQDKNGGKPYMDKYNGSDIEKQIQIEPAYVHNFRQCKWVIGSEIVYMNGPVPFNPRDPRDISYALSPVIMYRSTLSPYAQLIKPHGKMIQNAFNGIQMEMSKMTPYAYNYNIAAIDKITSIDGMAVKRMHVIQMHRREGSIIWSSKGAVNADGSPREGAIPITPNPPYDMSHLERWLKIIDFEEAMMEKAGGGPVNTLAEPAKDLSVFQSKLAVKQSNESMGQAMDAMEKIYTECAIATVGRLQLLVKKGYYRQYISGIGMSLLRPLSIDENIIGEFGYKIEAKLTAQGKGELKQIIAQAFGQASTPVQGSPYLADLLLLNNWIDGDVNTKIICLMASYLQKKNMAAMTQQAQEQAQANAQQQVMSNQQATQAKLALEQELSKMRMAEDDHATDNQIRLLQVQAQLHTQGALITNEQKATHKQAEIVQKAAVERPAA